MEQLVSKKRKHNDHTNIEIKQVKCEDSEEGCGLKSKAKKNPMDPPPKVLKEKRGLVTHLINKSYGVATLLLDDVGSVGVIFDTCAFWHNGAVLVEKCLSLQEVIEVGDCIKFNAVKISEGDGDERNVLYLATAIMKVGDPDEQLWDLTAVEYLSDLPNQKIYNFYSVLSYLSTLPISIFEREMIKKSKTSFVTNGKSLDDEPRQLESSKCSKNLSTVNTLGNAVSKTSPYNWFGQQCTSFKPIVSTKQFQLCTSTSLQQCNSIENLQKFNNPKAPKQCTSSAPQQCTSIGNLQKSNNSKDSKQCTSSEQQQQCSSFEPLQQCTSSKSLQQCTSSKSLQQCTSSKSLQQFSSSEPPHQFTSSKSLQQFSSSEPPHQFTRSKSLQQFTTCNPSADSQQGNHANTSSVVSSVEGFPPGFGVLEGFLVKLIGVSDFLDCLLCLQTLSMQVNHEYLPFYQTHFKSSEHKEKAINSKSHKNLIKQYIGQRAIGQSLILQEKARLGLESLYACHDLELFKCNYCPKLGVTMWHFINHQNSPEHNKDFRLHCQNFLDGVCTRSVCQFKHYSKEFVLDSSQDPGFLPQDILRITSSELNLHPVTKLRQRQSNLGLQLPVFKKNNEVDGEGFTKRFCHVSLSLSHHNDDDRRIFFGKGSTNRGAKANAAIAALAALKVRQIRQIRTDPCPHGKSQIVGCWCLGAKSVFQH